MVETMVEMDEKTAAMTAVWKAVRMAALRVSLKVVLLVD